MRKMQDPARREMALGFYRLGFSHNEVATALDMMVGTLEREEELDPAWHDQVQLAMLTSFRPILHHATKLALQADAQGENFGSMAALKLVMDWYSRQLDREQQVKLAEMERENLQIQGQRFPILSSPEAVTQFLAELQAGPVIEADSWETDDPA